MFGFLSYTFELRILLNAKKRRHEERSEALPGFLVSEFILRFKLKQLIQKP